jgi:hypothetical protein
MSKTSARALLRRSLAACTAGALAAIVAASPLEGQAVAAVRSAAGTAGHAHPLSCASLTTLALPNTTVNSATVNNPPSSDAVHVGDFLPDDWNGRFQGVGGGGFVGGNADSPSLAAIWTGPRDPQGNFVWFGLMPCASFGGLNLTLTSGGVTTPAPFVISLNHFIYWLARDTNFDWRTMTYAQFLQFFQQSVSEFNSVIGTSNPDLSAFRHAGGKIVGLVPERTTS